MSSTASLVMMEARELVTPFKHVGSVAHNRMVTPARRDHTDVYQLICK